MILALVSLACLSLTLPSDASSVYHYDMESQQNEIVYSPVSDDAFLYILNFLKSEFTKFRRIHNKIYKSAEEEEKRFSNFILSLIKMDNHNSLHAKDEKKYKMKITHMSDWSSDELSQLNGLKVINTTGSLYLSPAVTIKLPDSFDWREHGAVTEVKNQNHCGSCYAFSSTGALEGQLWRKTKKLVSLSEQQIVDCDKTDFGCEGGWMSNVFTYVKNAGGLESEIDYQYISGSTSKPNNKCYFNKNKVVVTDTGFVQLPSGNEEKLREALVTVGPISIAISVPNSLHHYGSGIFHDDHCSTMQLNHAVLLVGYGTDKSTGTPYWIIKNSWSQFWGENGYFRLERNKGSCNIGKYSVYPLM